MSSKKIIVQKTATFTGHRDCVYSIERAPGPHHFFSAGGDGMVVRWDLQNPEMGELLAKVSASVYAMALLEREGQLWVGQNFEGIHVIDLASQKELRSIRLTTAAIFDIRFWRDYALLGTADGTIIVLDIPRFAVKKHIKASEKSVRSLAINEATGELAVGYSDNWLRVFSLKDFRLKFAWPGHANSVFTVTYSPDGRYLLSGSRDAHLKIWSVGQDYALHQSVVAHMYAINHIVYSPDGNYFATCSMDKSVKVWDAQEFALLKVIDRARHAGHGTSINKLYWSDYQHQLISGSDDRTLSAWRIDLH